MYKWTKQSQAMNTYGSDEEIHMRKTDWIQCSSLQGYQESKIWKAATGWDTWLILHEDSADIMEKGRTMCSHVFWSLPQGWR